jgi:ABC-2 type transport system ATP-binding protein
MMLQAQNLKKSYRRADGTDIQAVRGVSFEVAEGEIFSLLGPNGAGKTTTISMISGLVAPSVGDATIGGYSITQDALTAKSQLGVIPQEIALYPTLSARRNLAFFGQMYGLQGAELNKRIDEVLEFIDLTDRQNDRVDTFSGGMKRRVNIGVGLLHRPRLVFMDEPTVGIDPQNRRRILDTVFRLRDEYGMTVLYTTHLMEEAQELSDRVGIIDHGEIIAMGTQGELTQQVGEEDRLRIHTSDSQVAEEVLEALRTSDANITHITFETLTEGEEETGLVTVLAKRGRKILPHVIGTLNDAQITITSVEVREPDLEAVFLKLTGRALRD